MPASFIAPVVAPTVAAAATTSVGLLGYAAGDWSSRFAMGTAGVMPQDPEALQMLEQENKWRQEATLFPAAADAEASP